ncbi:hypothetical protein [Herbiconiux moechotypicola]|uniref:hypothetical protein n=1 Tax=Herbiconiux moechotypicola TaxID=637393 RepID=UPI0031CE0225
MRRIRLERVERYGLDAQELDEAKERLVRWAAALREEAGPGPHSDDDPPVVERR